MTITTKSGLFYPEIFTDAIQAGWPNMMALYGTGAAIINANMPWGGERVGEKVKVPYFGSLGELEDIITDGDALTPAALSQSVEEAVVAHAGKAFEITKFGADAVSDPYEEAARQMIEATQRRIDRALFAAALTTPLTIDDGSNALSFDHVVEAVAMFGDALEDIAMLAVSSKTYADLHKERDLTNGRPLLVDPSAGGLKTVLGIPVVVSDKLAPSLLSLSAVTADGTTPPTVTVSGTPASSHYKFIVKCTKAGARGTSEIKWSSNNGVTWSAAVVTAATIALGDTGITLAMVNAAAAIDNVWTFGVTGVHTSLLCKKGSLVAWVNGTPSIDTDKDIYRDTQQAAVHVYYAVHRYVRMPGLELPGVVKLSHL